jgi:hypothetical protein
MHIMDKRIMDLFDYNECLKVLDNLLLEYELATYKMSGNALKSKSNYDYNKTNYNSNNILNKVIKRIECEDDYNYIHDKFEEIYSYFCDVEKEYFTKCLLYRKCSDETFSELMNISMMNMRKVKKSVVFKITEGFSISVMKSV